MISCKKPSGKKLNYRLFNVLIPYRAQGLKAMIEEKPIKKFNRHSECQNYFFQTEQNHQINLMFFCEKGTLILLEV